MEGRFIVLEGIDGCGKGTQAKLLANWLFDADKRNTVVLTREPYRLVGEIRTILKSAASPSEKLKELAELFVKDRKIHIRECIAPSLKKGHFVVSDRYKYSTLVYQSCQGMDIRRLVALHARMPVPDLAIIIDVPAEVAAERLQKDARERRPNAEMFEELGFMKKLREGYRNLPGLLPEEKFAVIDGNRPVDEVFNGIMAAVKSVL